MNQHQELAEKAFNLYNAARGADAALTRLNSQQAALNQFAGDPNTTDEMKAMLQDLRDTAHADYEKALGVLNAAKAAL